MINNNEIYFEILGDLKTRVRRDPETSLAIKIFLGSHFIPFGTRKLLILYVATWL